MTQLPTDEELNTAIRKASDVIYNYIASRELMDAFVEIRTTHKLHLDEAGRLSDVLNAVFLGVRPAADFPELLKLSLEQNSSAYDSVLRDVNEKIFVPFRRKLSEPAAPVQKAEEKVVPMVPQQPSQPQTPMKTAMERLQEGSTASAEKVNVRTLENSSAPARPQEPSSSQPTRSVPDPYREAIG